jgi:DNA-binding transcriptional LysR family regulator
MAANDERGTTNVLHEDVFDREPPLPTIIALRVALLAERLGSFTRVADELEMTQSGVSRSIARLEQMTGRRLFVRTRGGVTPTQIGAEYLSTVRGILTDLGAATLGARNAGSEVQRLHIATLPSFGSLWLAPRLKDLFERNPEISLEVTTNIGSFDFSHSPFDCVIHYGTGVWSEGGRSELMMHETVLPYASPDLLERVGGKASLDTLTGLTLIHHSHRPFAWRDWYLEIGRPYTERTHTVRFEQYQMGIQAAVSGLGAVLMPPFLVDDHTAHRRLVPLYDHEVMSQWRYYLVSLETARQNPSFKKFRSWLLKAAKKSESKAKTK